MSKKITKWILAISCFVCCSFSSISQAGHICFSIDETGIIQRAYESFEKDIFAYYKFGKDSVKTYRTFLSEVVSLSIDIRKLPSNNSIQITRDFKKKAEEYNSIWVKLADYESQEASDGRQHTASITANDEEILIFNYRGGFIQCLKNNSDSEDFKEIISTLEIDANVSTSLIAQRLYYIVDQEFEAPEIKKFIAFDIYFSILMVVEKAFG